MLQLPPDPYKILGVSKTAEASEIRSAHRKLVLKCHPDKVQDPEQKAIKQDEFQKVQQAYELLSDANGREKYDEQVKLVELQKKLAAANISTPRTPPRYPPNVSVRTAEPPPFKPTPKPTPTAAKMYQNSPRSCEDELHKVRISEEFFRGARRTASYDERPPRRKEEERRRTRELDEDEARQMRKEREKEQRRSEDKRRREKEKERDRTRRSESEDKRSKMRQPYIEPHDHDYDEPEPVYVKEKPKKSSSSRKSEEKSEKQSRRARADPEPTINLDERISTARNYMHTARLKDLKRSNTDPLSSYVPVPPTVPMAPSEDEARRSSAKPRRSSYDSRVKEKSSSHKKSSGLRDEYLPEDGYLEFIDVEPRGKRSSASRANPASSRQFLSSVAPEMVPSLPRRGETFHYGDTSMRDRNPEPRRHRSSRREGAISDDDYDDVRRDPRIRQARGRTASPENIRFADWGHSEYGRRVYAVNEGRTRRKFPEGEYYELPPPGLHFDRVKRAVYDEADVNRGTYFPPVDVAG